MFQAPYNKVVVKVKTKWVGNFTNILKAAGVSHVSSVVPEDMVNNIGIVVSVPKAITTNRRDYKGYSTADIKPGDTIIMSTGVIFDFESTKPEEEPRYKNLVTYRAEEYWLADIQYIYATIRDGKIRMQNGYVMVEEIEKKPILILPHHLRKRLRTASARVSYIGKPLTHLPRIDADHGDMVYYNPNKIVLQQVNEKPFGILRQDHILGKSIPEYAELVEME